LDKPLTNADLVEHLCSVSAKLREARKAHLRIFGMLIPHVFMTQVLVRVGYCLSLDRGEAQATHRAEARSILKVLERGLAEGARETRNVISASFVNDAELELFFEDIRPMLGPRLKAQLQGK